MARTIGPKWHKAQRLWYARVGERGPDNRRKAVYMTRPVGDPPVQPPQGQRDEGQAWKWLEAYQQEAEARKVLPGDPTVRALCELYLRWAQERRDAGKMAPVHWAARQQHLTRLCHYAPPGAYPLGARRARELTPQALSGAIESWQREYSPHYVRNIVASALAAFAWATRPGSNGEGRLLDANPLDGFQRPTVPRFDGRYMAVVDARRFLRWCWARGRAGGPVQSWHARLTVLLWQFVRLTGCRPGEACGLTWDAIRWEDGRINLADHKTMRYGKARTIYLTPALTRLLRAIERHPRQHPRYVFTHGRGRGGIGAGGPWNSTTLAARFRALRTEAAKVGLDVGRVTAYWLRHSYITDALLDGASYADVAKMAGNSPAVLESVYDHPVHERLAERAKELARKRRKASG